MKIKINISKLLSFLALIVLSTYAFADRYGVDEALAESDGVPSWLNKLLVLMAFIFLLYRYFKETDELRGSNAYQQIMHDKEIKLLKTEITDLKCMNDELIDNYLKFSDLVNEYVYEGVLTDEEFVSAGDKHMEYSEILRETIKAK